MILGIDYSISSPALCGLFEDGSVRFSCLTEKIDSNVLWGDETFSVEYVSNKFKKLHPDRTDTERFDYAAAFFTDTIKGWLIDEQCAAAVIEDYSYGSKGRVFHIAEATGALKNKVWRKTGILFTVAAPSELKKFFHGKGNADKRQMWDACYTRHRKVADALIGHTWVKTVRKKQMKVDILPGDSPMADMVDAYAAAQYAGYLLRGEG